MQLQECCIVCRSLQASLRAIDALHMEELGGRYIEARCQGSKGREEMNRRKMVHMIRLASGRNDCRHEGRKLGAQRLNVRSRISC